MERINGALRRAAESIDDVRPGTTSRAGRSGVWLARLLFQLLRPYTWRVRAVDQALLDAVSAVSAAAMASADRQETALKSVQTRVDEALSRFERVCADVQRLQGMIDSSPPWTVARVLARNHPEVSATAITLAVTLPGTTDMPSGCIRVKTDEGELWAIERDRVITPNLRDLGTWETSTTRSLTAHVRPGMVAMDIGANIGYVSRTLARLVGASGMVIAMEPEPENFAVLCANLRDRPGDVARCVRAAASDQNGVTRLWLDDENLGDHRTWGNESRTGRSIRVPAVRVDDLVDDAIKVDAVKIDTQGTDHIVIRGMEALIARCRPFLLVEFWPDGIEGAGGRAADVLDYYRSLGMSIGVGDDDGRLYPSNDQIIDFTLNTRDGYVSLLLLPA